MEKWALGHLMTKLSRFNEENGIHLFRDANEGKGIYPTTKFFQDNKTEVFEIEGTGDQYEIFESMRIYIERFGRPYNYLKSVGELNEEREKYLVQEESTCA